MWELLELVWDCWISGIGFYQVLVSGLENLQEILQRSSRKETVENRDNSLLDEGITLEFEGSSSNFSGHLAMLKNATLL